MNAKLKMLIRNERGITALETAIILIAFVVVASVFAFTILSAGTYSTEKSKQAIYSGIAGVSSSLEVRGSVTAEKHATSGNLQFVYVSVGTAAGGDSIEFSGNQPMVSFRTITQSIASTVPTLSVPVQRGTANNLLDDGELGLIKIDVSAFAISTNTFFAIEIKPKTGSTLLLERTTPAYLDAVVDLK